MKTKHILSVLALMISISAFSQTSMELTFTAENSGQYVPMDSILIENLTQGVDTTLYAPDTVLFLDYITSIGNNETIDRNTISVSQNYPNPFKEKTEIVVYIPEEEYVNITVHGIMGRVLAHYENTLSRGNHYISFYAGNENYYLFTVTGKQTSHTIKMFNTNDHTNKHEKCKIVYTGYNENLKGLKYEQVFNNFGFLIGDQLKYTAYTDVEETEIIDTPFGSQTYSFQFDGWTPCPGTSTVTDVDGNIYNTVQIGAQCWIKENLKTTNYRNGTQIPNVIDSEEWLYLTSGAYVWYDNDSIWKDKYGAMYNWYAVDDVNGLCPTGWHVPTSDEWTSLTTFIGGTNSPYGNELKSCRQENSPYGEACNTTEHPLWYEYNQQYGTDDYGLSCLPAGMRDVFDFEYLTFEGFWWSSTQNPSFSVGFCNLSFLSGDINLSDLGKVYGFSVRCLKD